jgi:hypothetical protein
MDSEYQELLDLINAQTKLIQAQQNTLAMMQNNMVGLTAGVEILGAFIIEGSPEIKNVMGEATKQMLSRPENIQNDYLRYVLTKLHAAATKSSQLTPEGRRDWFRVIDNPAKGSKDK